MNKLTSKQRAHLKSLAQTIEPIFQIGKGGITPELTKSVDEALEARELVKINVLSNCMDTPQDASETISGRTKSIPVQVIGRKIVLYRLSKTKPKIQLPK